MSAEHHLDAELLARLLAGTLTDAEGAALRRHLDECPTCLEFLASPQAAALDTQAVALGGLLWHGPSPSAEETRAARLVVLARTPQPRPAVWWLRRLVPAAAALASVGLVLTLGLHALDESNGPASTGSGSGTEVALVQGALTGGPAGSGTGPEEATVKGAVAGGLADGDPALRVELNFVVLPAGRTSGGERGQRTGRYRRDQSLVFRLTTSAPAYLALARLPPAGDIEWLLAPTPQAGQPVRHFPAGEHFLWQQGEIAVYGLDGLVGPQRFILLGSAQPFPAGLDPGRALTSSRWAADEVQVTVEADDGRH